MDNSWALLFLSALQLFLLVSGISAAGPTYKQYKANIKGDVLVIDVGGMHTLGNHPDGPLISAPTECQAWCDRLPGCTGWTFCNKRDGCGSGCKSYEAANPTPGGFTSTGLIDPSTKLPIKWFGPLSGQMHKCVDDKWAYGICSLKNVPNPSKPQFWSTKPAEGWVSGVLLFPFECKGLSALACRQCAASKNPAICRSCASAASRLQSKLLDSVTGYVYQLTWPEGCAACAALPASQERVCSSCLAGGKACGQCAAEKLSRGKTYFDLASCLTCTRNNPAAVSPECQACASLSDAAKKAKCGACITSLGKRLIPDATSTNRIARGDFCANCVRINTPKVADTCIACGKAMPYNDDCYECSSGYNVPGLGARPACYACAFKVKIGRDTEENLRVGLPYMCSECLGDSADSALAPQLKPQCKACLYDPKVTYRGKYWCNTCVERIEDPTALKKCIDCLKKPGITDYFSQCVQANYP